MKAGTAQKVSNAILSCAAGLASFLFSLAALLYLREFDQKILASLVAGAFCLLVSYIACERPNSDGTRALAALGERLLAVEEGDLVSLIDGRLDLQKLLILSPFDPFTTLFNLAKLQQERAITVP